MRIKKCFTFAFLLLFAFALSLGMITDASATEGGGSAYPNGAEDFMAGAVPPPGTYFINYFQYYTANEFKDAPFFMEDFDLQATVNAFRIIHVTKYKILGGFLGAHIFIPLANIHVEIDTNIPMGKVSDSKAGLADIVVGPLLSWHFKNWHFATGVDVVMPTGDYDKEDLANTGRNYWTFEPIVAFTYLSDNGFEVSSKFMYDFNTENNDSLVISPAGPVEGDYQSGQEFHFDYTVGKKFGPLSVGVGGYYYKQITKDEFDDEKVGEDGNKGEVFAFGPQIKYDYKKMSFILKYQHEVDVDNKPEGDKFWFKFVYAF